MLPVFILLVFIIVFTYFAYKRKQTMKKDPVRAVGTMMIILGIFVVAVPVINIFENEKTPEWYFAVVFLMCSLTVIYSAFKHQQRRIDALEEKLNEQASPKELQ
jgi:cbb3-type cytochrome oxidase subunit 3